MFVKNEFLNWTRKDHHLAPEKRQSCTIAHTQQEGKQLGCQISPKLGRDIFLLGRWMRSKQKEQCCKTSTLGAPIVPLAAIKCQFCYLSDHVVHVMSFYAT